MMTTILLLLLLLLSTFFAAGVSILDPGDFLALQSVRKSLEDMPGSTFFSAWDFTGDPCAFPGVFCAGDKVAALTLGDPAAGSPGLIGRLDPSIGCLASLTELSLLPGRVTGPIPSTISLLTELRFLALSRNFLSGRIPPSISSLLMLRTLDLSYNQLTGPVPASLSRVCNLTNLMLSHNRLSGQIPLSLSALPQLIRLDLKHNALTGRVTALPSSLHYLSLSWNHLSGPTDGFLPRLSALNYLDLSVNAFTGFIPARIFTFPLTSLQLQRNQLTGAVVPDATVGIQTVDLSYNRLTGMISPHFATVQNLYLNNNRFMGVVPEGFVARLMDAGIQVLYLQHNFLTGIEINPTAEIPMSSELCLQYNCMVPPLQTPCPLKAGKQKTRPTEQCTAWRSSSSSGTLPSLPSSSRQVKP